MRNGDSARRDSDRGRSTDSRDADLNRSRDRDRSRDRGKSKDKDRDRDRRRESSRDRKRRSRSRDRRRSRSRDKVKTRSRSRDRKRRSRSRDRKRSRSRDRKPIPGGRDRRRSRSRDRKLRSKSRERRERRRTKSRSRSRGKFEGFGRTSRAARSPSPTGLLGPNEDLTPEERDMRTVLCLQLAARVRPRDLEGFFSSVGKVRDVRLIMCNKTRKFKGICYVEFVDPDSVPLAIGLSGQKLLGIPIIVQPTQAEKNRQGTGSLPIIMPGLGRTQVGPMKLYVGSLHFNITEEMLRNIFEPFGKIDSVQLAIDPETGRSKGYGFITFLHVEDAKRAIEQLNGFELAGRPMKVGHVSERPEGMYPAASLDSDDMDRAGIELGATGRLHLMAKLAQGTGLELPPAAATALSMSMNTNTTNTMAQSAAAAAPPIATQCFMLSNMFTPGADANPDWDQEIRDDVIEECNKHGGVVHIFVDKASPQGNVYVKCTNISAAAASVSALHGRWFGAIKKPTLALSGPKLMAGNSQNGIKTECRKRRHADDRMNQMAYNTPTIL
ncbi:hypothetical protein QYM36_002064 [Artemia franciscana]|uniref:RRM domain-containing protein n=1 Tax=Artemia franciscana TaxID=6661 RepID=A0AA88IKY1_ARTSF|nr:hypothetical protein QYM36_002064 [Artemia franciscana]